MITVVAGGSIPAVIGLNVVQGSATNAIEKYISTGKVDMNQVLQSGVMEGVTAGLMPSGSSKGVNSITDSLDNNVDNAVSSTIKNANNNVNDAVSATIDSADNYLDEGADAANTLSKNADTSPSVPSVSDKITLSKPSSKTLRQNMINEGIDAPDYANAAHHIVAGNSPKAAEARAIFQNMV